MTRVPDSGLADGQEDDSRVAAARERILGDLRALGVRPGQTLLVHASLRSIGNVAGTAVTVAGALREAVGERGNIVVPASTEANSRTSRAHREQIAAMSPAGAKEYREKMPAFDPDRTPSNAGAISETVRTAEGAVRSQHPQSSFAAVGPDAWYLMADHQLSCHLGEDSPLGKLYKQDESFVLLLGVGYQACTAFHLAEYRYTSDPPKRTYACVVTENGKRRWKTYRDVVLDDRQFEAIGEHIETTMTWDSGYVGNAICRLLPLGQLVDKATEWMKVNRF